MELTLCASAVVAGMRSFTAIAGRVADTPPPLLHQLYGPCLKPAVAPSRTSIWQILTNADAAVGAWLAVDLVREDPAGIAVGYVLTVAVANAAVSASFLVGAGPS